MQAASPFLVHVDLAMPTLGADFGGEFGMVQAMQLVAGHRRSSPMLSTLTHMAFIPSELTANFLRFPKEFESISTTRHGDDCVRSKDSFQKSKLSQHFRILN